jgi:ferredoxin--NADP+ reductase
MTYVITESCVGVKDVSCVAVCPVNCIIATDDDPFMMIDPSECIDCGACIPECPVDAIYPEDTVPPGQEQWKAINQSYFQLEPAAFQAKFKAAIEAAKQNNRSSPHANPAFYT